MTDPVLDQVTPNPSPNPAPEPKIPEGFVSQDVFEREKKDRQKFKEERDSLKKQMDEQRLNALKTSQNWEAVAKEQEEKAKSEEQRRQALETSIIQHQKFMALKTEALKQNMHPSSLDDLELLDLPEINVETTSTGKILVTGADRAIAGLKALRPHWFKQNAPSINPQTPETHRVDSSNITMEVLSKLEQEYKKNPNQANKEAYFQAIQKFKTK